MAVAPMTVAPEFAPVGGEDDFARYLVDGVVLTAGLPIDSTALSLYRIARRRGWDEWAARFAEATARRVEEAGDGDLVHGVWSAGETHVRYLNDALLLLSAHGDRSAAIERAADMVEAFAVDAPGGRWVLHDSLERDAGRNDFVLNTHVHAMIALRSAGRDVSALEGALEVALADVDPRRRLRRTAPRALRRRDGWIARDLTGEPAPSYYLTVNVADLAALGGFDDVVAAALGWARRTGFFAEEIRARSPLAAVIPHALRLAGDEAAARDAAAQLTAAGVAPMIGWPDHVDHLWPALPPGTP